MNAWEELIMGKHKKTQLDRIREGERKGEDILAYGEKLEIEAREIKSEYGDIDKTMDEDDVTEIDIAMEGHREDFNNEFSGEVEMPGDVVKTMEQDIVTDINSDIQKVGFAADKLRNIESTTDIGKNHATDAIRKMNNSEQEYNNYIDQSNKITENLGKKIDSAKARLNSDWC